MDRNDQTTKKPQMKLLCQAGQPSYANPYAAGLDLRVQSDGPIHFERGDHAFIHTGTYCQIPHGYFGLVAIRSSLGVKGLVLSNGVGVIDEDYRGELMVPLYYHGEEGLDLENGERVAQMIIIPYIQPEIQYVDHLDASDRGEEGFGSSGRF